MSDFVMQIGADLDLSKVQEQLDAIKKQKVTLDVEIKGTDEIKEGDILDIDLKSGTIKNITSGKTFKAEPFPPFMQKLIDAGGLINYVKK